MAENGAEAKRQQSRSDGGVCRCCLLEGTFGTMKRSYCWRGHTQTYSDMLRYVFGITLTWDHGDQLICGVCEIRLRQAFTFWRQILDSNKKLIKVQPNIVSVDHIPSKEINSVEVYIEVEPENVDPGLVSEADLNNFDVDAPLSPITQEDTNTDNADAKQSKLAEALNNIQPLKPKYKGQISSTPNFSDEIKTKDANGLNYTTLNCIFCCKLFESELEFTFHSSTCELRSKKILPKKCTFCVTEFEADSILISKHMWTQHRYRTEHLKQACLKCDICNENFSNIKMKVTHVQRSHHTCHECYKTFPNMYEKNDHMLSHAVTSPNLPKPTVCQQGSAQCLECKEVFTSEELCQIHIHRNHAYRYSCEKCNERFLDEKAMLQHKVEVHDKPILSHPVSTPDLPKIVGRQRKKCSECDEIFETKNLRRAHFKRVHGIKCVKCDERFFGDKAIHKHKVEAHGKPMFKCGACDNSYYTNYRLNIHQRVHHMQEKKFSCPQCDYVSFTTSRMKNHMISHTKEKTFICSYCSKGFSRNSALSFHMRIHTGDKRQVCKVCGQAFVQRASLKYHLEKHHPGEL